MSAEICKYLRITREVNPHESYPHPPTEMWKCSCEDMTGDYDDEKCDPTCRCYKKPDRPILEESDFKFDPDGNPGSRLS